MGLFEDFNFGDEPVPGDWNYTPVPSVTQSGSSGYDWGGLLGTVGGGLLDIGKAVAPTVAGLAAAKASPWLTNLASGGYFKDAKGLINQSTNRVANIKGADLTNLIPELKMQVMQGSMSPAQAQAYQASLIGTMNAAQADVSTQGDSGMGNVVSDADTIEAQRQALTRLADVGQNGMTPADRAQLQAAMNQAAAKTAQERAAAIQALQMQGNAGTGAELAARLSAAQSGANANANAGAQVASDAQARALAAIQANLAGSGNLNTQLFNQAAQKAQAQDAVNQFNTAARNAMAQQNAQFQQQANQQNFNTANQIGLANQTALNNAAQLNAQLQQAANAQNFNTANQIAGTNTQIMNKQAMLPLETAQQSFTNKLNQAQTAAGAGLTGAKLLNEQGNIIAGASTAAAQQAANATNAALNQPKTTTTTQPSSSGSGGKKDYSGTGAAIGGVVGSIFPVVGTALGSAAGGLLGKIFSDEELKEHKKELTDKDVDDMFGQLTGYRYRYKGSPIHTQGVMAQDVENTPNRNAVIDTPAGKMISGDMMLGQVLAGLANNTDRIKRLEGKK